jgi:hypothetical protein
MKAGQANKVARLEPLQEQRARSAAWLASLFSDPNSVASQTAAAYAELLDEAILDVSQCAVSPVSCVCWGGGAGRAEGCLGALPSRVVVCTQKMRATSNM